MLRQQYISSHFVFKLKQPCCLYCLHNYSVQEVKVDGLFDTQQSFFNLHLLSPYVSQPGNEHQQASTAFAQFH